MKQLELENIQTALNHQLCISMHYESHTSPKQTGKLRMECTMKFCARVGLISPTFVGWLYKINRSLALEHLNRLVQLELLSVVPTHRSIDGRVYVLTYTGAQYVQELLQQHVPFRSSSNPAMQINQNTVMHDSILQFVLARGIQSDDKNKQEWTGFVTEPEFKRLYPSTEIRNVDALIAEPSGTICALEVEHSFKPITLRKTILLKYLNALKSGVYEKVFFVSQSLQILEDAKRINAVALDNLTNVNHKKTGKPQMAVRERELLEKSLIYRTKFCAEISALFYS